MSRRHRGRKGERWALIAQILGGLGTGIAGIKKQADDREARQADLALKRTEMDRQQSRYELDAKREDRMAKLTESEIALNEAKAAAEGRGKVSFTAQDKGARAAMLARGIDPDAPDAVERAMEEYKKVTQEADAFEKANTGNMKAGPIEANSLARQRKTADSLLLAVDMLKRQGAGAATPGARPNPMTGQPAAPTSGAPGMTMVDEKAHGDALGATGSLIGAMQSGQDLLSPIFFPVWNTIRQAFGIQPPMGVQLQQQGMGPQGQR